MNGMNGKKLLYAGCILTGMVSFIYGEVISPDSSLLEQQRRIEKDMALVIQERILDPMLGKNRAGVVVNIELEIKKQVTQRSAKRRKQEEKSKFADQEFILPGLPSPRSVTSKDRPREGKSEASTVQETQFNYIFAIKRRMITVICDKRIKDRLISLVETTIREAFNLGKGDTLEFKKARFVKGYLNEFTRPLMLLSLIFGVLLLLFLFGPLAGFFRSLVRTMRDKGGTEVSVDSKFENAPGDEEGEGKGGGDGGTLTPGELAAREEEEKRYKPFRYINQENLKRLVYLLRKEPPKIIALVVSYLKTELVKEIISILPPELQTQVAVNMATIRQMTEAQVMAVDQEIKEKIDFLVGGLDSLLKVLDEIDVETKNNILEYLEQEKPELYDMVRKSILVFDDIPQFPDQSLQIILRELKTDTLAQAMRDAPQEVIDKIFRNMSSGAAALLKEEMEYGRLLTPEQIEEERKKILDTIKILERDGKIVIREREKNTVLQGEEEIDSADWEGIAGSAMQASAEHSAGASNELYDYYQGGVSLYEAGRYDEALTYFNYCVQADPAMWQAHQYIGIVHHQLGRNNAALQAFQAALQINPRDQGLRDWVENIQAAKT